MHNYNGKVQTTAKAQQSPEISQAAFSHMVDELRQTSHSYRYQFPKYVRNQPKCWETPCSRHFTESEQKSWIRPLIRIPTKM